MKTWNEYKTAVKAQSSEAGREIEELEEQAAVISALICRRNELGLSQRELAELCRMPQSSVARIEANRTTPNLDTLLRLCKPLGLKISVAVG